MSDRESHKWEVSISVYRCGHLVKISDGFGKMPDTALYDAYNDLELWAQDHPESAAKAGDPR